MKIYNVKLKDAEVNFIKAICGNPTPAFNMKIRLVYTEMIHVKRYKKSWAVKPNYSIF